MNTVVPVALAIAVWVSTFELAFIFLAPTLSFPRCGAYHAPFSKTSIRIHLVAGYLVVGVFVLIVTSSIEAAVIAVTVNLFFFLVSLFCHQRQGKKRQDLINRELPLLLDHMVLQIESGHSIQQALRSAPRLFLKTGPLYFGLVELDEAMMVGRALGEALKNFSQKLNTPEADVTLSAISQAVGHGTPLGKVLREQSKRMRESLILEGEQFANTLSVKILIPLLFFIFPASFLVIFSPIIVSISGGLK